MNEYEHEHKRLTNEILDNFSLSFFDNAGKLELADGLLASYRSSYPNMLERCFDNFDVDQLRAIDKVYFIAQGNGIIDFYFKDDIQLTASLDGYYLIPSTSGKFRLRLYTSWVDRY